MASRGAMKGSLSLLLLMLVVAALAAQVLIPGVAADGGEGDYKGENDAERKKECDDRDSKEGDTPDKRKGGKKCDKEKSDSQYDPSCCNEDKSGNKINNNQYYETDYQCGRDKDGDKLIKEDNEKGTDFPWTCTYPDKFCNCSDKVWQVGPYDVGNVPADYATTQQKTQKWIINNGPPSNNPKPLSRADCCKACSDMNTGKFLDGSKKDFCAYWVHYVPPTGKVGVGSEEKSCSNSAGLGYCLIFPPGQKPSCKDGGPICKPDGDDSGLKAFKGGAKLSTLGKGCPGGKNDPHFVGAYGTHFDFNGVPDESFCLVTDPSFHVNMKMRGYYDSRTVGASILKNGKAIRTWIKDLGIMWVDSETGATHTLKLAARSGKEQERGNGYMESIIFDGVAIPQMTVGEAVQKEGGLTVRFVGYEKEGGGYFDVDAYEVSIAKRMGLEIRLRVAHPLLQTPEDAMAHINVRFMYLEHSDQTHGVLGQTFRPGRERRAVDYTALSVLMGRDVAADSALGRGFLDGVPGDYKTTDVLSPDCKFSTYSA